MTRVLATLMWGVLGVACRGSPPPAQPAEPPIVPGSPRVVALAEQAQACWHWSGEESEDPTRAAEIRRNVEATCGAARAQLTQVPPAEAAPGVGAALAVFLLGETPERCALLPAADLPRFDVDDEARARCSGLSGER